MIVTLWAFSERLVPRIASAAVSVTFAAVAGPTSYGYYAAALLLFLGVQSVTDSAVRQIAVEATLTSGGRRFLKQYGLLCGLAGSTSLLVGLLIFANTFADLQSASALAPIAIAPVAWAISANSLARLQVSGKWRLIAILQAVSTVTSCVCALPLVFTSTPLLAPSLQLALAEMLFAVALCASANRNRTSKPPATSPAVGSAQTWTATRSQWRAYGHAVQYSGLSWLQSQADRVIISLVAGPARFGQYSLAYALSRNVADSLSIGMVNVLRPQVVASSSKAAQQAIEASLRRGSILLSALFGLALLISQVAPIALGPEWDEAAPLVPALAVSALPAFTAWCLTPMLVRNGSLRIGTVAKLVGLVFGIGAAATAIFSLQYAAWLAIGREVLVASIQAVYLRDQLSLSAYRWPALVLLGMCAVSAVVALTL